MKKQKRKEKMRSKNDKSEIWEREKGKYKNEEKRERRLLNEIRKRKGNPNKT